MDDWDYVLDGVKLTAWAFTLQQKNDIWNIYFYKFEEWVRQMPDPNNPGKYIDDATNSYQEERGAVE